MKGGKSGSNWWWSNGMVVSEGGRKIQVFSALELRKKRLALYCFCGKY